MKEFKPVKEGKVREVYDNGDSMIMLLLTEFQLLMLF